MGRIKLNKEFSPDKILLDCSFFDRITNFLPENKEE